MKYFPELDTFRALAVLMVIIGHWLPFQTDYTYLLGMTGVVMFFTLSGYLITRILLAEKGKTEELVFSKKVVLKNFYMRRILRIFPIYYLYIFFLFLIPDITGTSIKTDFFWYFTYLGNYFTHITGNTNYILGHTWSLAVEEQFYLVWPFLILFVNKKVLPYIMVIMVLVTLIFRWIMIYKVSYHKDTVFMLTPSSLDSFGLGALLAWIQMKKSNVKLVWFWTTFFLGGLFIFVNVAFNFNEFSVITNRTFASLFSVGLIGLLIFSKNPNSTYFFRLKPLLFIGKISYGLYLYHFFVPWLFEVFEVISKKFSFRLNLHESNLNFVFYSITLAFISILSWYLIEKPILSLKVKYKT